MAKKKIFIAGQEVAKKEYVDEQINNIDLSGKQDIMQFSTMPTASSETVGKVIQYTGTTTQDYTNGYFYIGTVEGEVGEEVYSWERLAVQPETEIPADLKVFCIEEYDENHPFILSEHKTGIYYFNPKRSEGGYNVYFKVKRRDSVYDTPTAVYIYPNSYFTYYNQIEEDNTYSTSITAGYMWSNFVRESYRTFYYGHIAVNVDNREKIQLYGQFINNTLSFINLAETISGKKTFSTLPESSITPTTDNQLTNKAYVDGLVGDINTVLATLTTPSGNGGN